MENSNVITHNTNNGNEAVNRKKYGFVVETAKEIQQAEIEHRAFLVDGIITPGLNLLAAPKKQGKSWFALDLALCTAGEKDFWGRKTKHGKVLYFALEDNRQRMQDRINRQLDDADAPENLLISYATDCSGDKFFKDLDAFLDENTDIIFVIIDVLQMIRSDKKNSQTEYAHDYKDVGTLKAIADKHQISLLLVTHTKKGKEADRLNRISGGVGVTGAADTILMIGGADDPSSKDGKSGKERMLYITGRDVPEEHLSIRFENETCRWKYVGSEEDFLIKQEEERYQTSPVAKTVTVLLEQNNGRWEGTSTELLECGLQVTGAPIAKSESALARKVNGLDPLFEKNGILHQRPNPNGGIAGRKHIFAFLDQLSDAPKPEGEAD
ncbi:MAG: AAA family ATPase [Lachnoclostridium sp.]|nr:AAA family ATPase [Lachnoclostridium sp.]